MSELALDPRLPGRMPYGLLSRPDGEELESVGKRGSQASTSEESEGPKTPLTTPVHTARSLNASPEKEPEDLVFATPPEENKSVGTLANHPAADKEGANGNLLGPLNELAASPPYPVNDRGPAGTIQTLLAGQEASEGAVPPSVKSEGEHPTESEPTVVSTWPSSPVSEGEDNPTIPPFQFTQPLNVSTDSRGNDLSHPSERSLNCINDT